MSLGSNTVYTTDSLWAEALTRGSGSKTVNPKNNKIRKSDQIKYQTFLTGSEYVTDEYWKDLLVKAAKGKFPRGFAYNDGYLLHRGSGVSIQIPEDPVGLVQAVVFFMRQKGNIFSPNDLATLESAAQQHLIDGEPEDVVWARIFKAKNTRARYIRDYSERVYSGLPLKIIDEYYTQINTYLELGTLKKDDIIFAQGQIQNIDGLIATPAGIRPTRDLTVKI